MTEIHIPYEKIVSALRQRHLFPGDAIIAKQVAEFQSAAGTEPVLDDIEIYESDLCEVFGPQWEHVVHFIRRVGTLSRSEVAELQEAWDVLGDDAVKAVKQVRWLTPKEMDLDATWGSVGGAAGAVGAAVLALVVRDLVGDGGITKGHYDAMTLPWRKVIGPVHPNDKDVHFLRMS
jgi:hypothetical protein